MFNGYQFIAILLRVSNTDVEQYVGVRLKIIVSKIRKRCFSIRGFFRGDLVFARKDISDCFKNNSVESIAGIAANKILCTKVQYQEAELIIQQQELEYE